MDTDITVLLDRSGMSVQVNCSVGAYRAGHSAKIWNKDRKRHETVQVGIRTGRKN